jgi:hypothetical protein
MTDVTINDVQVRDRIAPGEQITYAKEMPCSKAQLKWKWESPAQEEASQQPYLPPTVTYTNDKYGVSITHPSDWQVENEQAPTLYFAQAKNEVPMIELGACDIDKVKELFNGVLARYAGTNIIWGPPSDTLLGDGKTKGNLYLIKWDYPAAALITMFLEVDRSDNTSIYAAYTNTQSDFDESAAKEVLMTLKFK